jgi:hypothetical protein
MPQVRHISCRRAAGRPAIHADRSKDQRWNLHTAGQSVNSLQLREWLLSVSYHTTVHDLIEI